LYAAIREYDDAAFSCQSKGQPTVVNAMADIGDSGGCRRQVKSASLEAAAGCCNRENSGTASALLVICCLEHSAQPNQKLTFKDVLR
jgi:hypothetical protein